MSILHLCVRACVCVSVCVCVLAHSVGSWFLSIQVCTCTGHSPGHMTLRCGSHMIDCSWDQMYLLDKLEHKHIFESNFYKSKYVALCAMQKLCDVTCSILNVPNAHLMFNSILVSRNFIHLFSFIFTFHCKSNTDLLYNTVVQTFGVGRTF